MVPLGSTAIAQPGGALVQQLDTVAGAGVRERPSSSPPPRSLSFGMRGAFCARSFEDENSWKAAAIALDADSVSAHVAAFHKLRGIAGPGVWEKIVLQASEAARSTVTIQEDYDSIAGEIGYETAFSNQCSNVSRE